MGKRHLHLQALRHILRCGVDRGLLQQTTTPLHARARRPPRSSSGSTTTTSMPLLRPNQGVHFFPGSPVTHARRQTALATSQGRTPSREANGSPQPHRALVAARRHAERVDPGYRGRAHPARDVRPARRRRGDHRGEVHRVRRAARGGPHVLAARKAADAAPRVDVFGVHRGRVDAVERGGDHAGGLPDVAGRQGQGGKQQGEFEQQGRRCGAGLKSFVESSAHHRRPGFIRNTQC